MTYPRIWASGFGILLAWYSLPRSPVFPAFWNYSKTLHFFPLAELFPKLFWPFSASDHSGRLSKDNCLSACVKLLQAQFNRAIIINIKRGKWSLTGNFRSILYYAPFYLILRQSLEIKKGPFFLTSLAPSCKPGNESEKGELTETHQLLSKSFARVKFFPWIRFKSSIGML